VLVDPHHALLQADVDRAGQDRRVRRFADLNSATEFAEDILIDRYADPGVTADSIDVTDHPVLTGLGAHQRADLVSTMVIQRFGHGEQLVGAQQEPQGLFFILDGMVDMGIAVPNGLDHSRHHLSMFTAGTTFGVVYALARRPYDIDAHAVGAVRAAVLEMAALDQISEREPQLMLSLLRALVSTEFSNVNWVLKTVASLE